MAKELQTSSGHGYSSDEIARRVAACHEPGWHGELDLFRTEVTEADLRRLAQDVFLRERLARLHLGCNRLSDAAAEGLKQLTNVARLDLYGNELHDAAALAECLKPLTNLKWLNLDNNQLSDATSLAEGLKPLMNLTALGLSRNQLSDAVALAEGLKPLTSLAWLDLGHNRLSDAAPLGEGLSPNLTELYLYENELSDASALADGLKPLKNLTRLDLNHNHLTDASDLAESLRPLTNLTTLDLSSNQLSDAGALTESLNPLKKLTSLDLENNPGLGLPDEVVESRDPARILAALEEIATGQTTPVLEMKLVLLGNGRTGKTQLANRLLDKPFDEHSESTPHFMVHALPIRKVMPTVGDAIPRSIAGRLYDFGGQPHLWSAHRFFLASKHNLYVVVIDGTCEGLPQLKYWLEYVRRYTQDARPQVDADGRRATDASIAADHDAVPVLVLYSHSDCTTAAHHEGRQMFRAPDDAEVQALREDYQGVINLRVVRRYSSKMPKEQPEGLEEVRGHLRELAGGVNYIFTTQYPLGLHQVKDYLRGEREDVGGRKLKPFSDSIPRKDLYGLFRDAAAKRKPNDGDCELWLQMLRNLGVVHWVGDLGPKRDVRAGATIAETVYHPEWVQKLVYAIIAADPKDRTPTGVAGERRLCELMCRKCGKHEGEGRPVQPCHREILDLMRTCELIFVPRKSNEYLVLDWIPDARGYRADGRPVLAELVFERFLPESLLVRCAGQWYEELKKLNEDLCRDLVRVSDLANPDAQVEVAADVYGRRITLHRAAGPIEVARDFAAALQRDILRIAQAEELVVNRPKLRSVDDRRLPPVSEEGDRTVSKKHVFISYCHDDQAEVAQLRNELEGAGVKTWWDQDILPGHDFKFEIRKAMKDAHAVVLCLSAKTQTRVMSGIYPEALDAIGVYREHAPGSIFLIPVRLSDCAIPPIEIDATRTLDRIQYVDLFPAGTRAHGVQRLLQAVGLTPTHP